MTQPRIAWEDSLLRGCLDLVVPWADLYGFCLNGFIAMGRPSPLWAASFLRQRVLNSLRVEELSWAQASVEGVCLLSFHILLTVDVTRHSCWKFLPWLLYNAGLSVGALSRNNLLPFINCPLSRCFHHCYRMKPEYPSRLEVGLFFFWFYFILV